MDEYENLDYETDGNDSDGSHSDFSKESVRLVGSAVNLLLHEYPHVATGGTVGLLVVVVSGLQLVGIDSLITTGLLLAMRGLAVVPDLVLRVSVKGHIKGRKGITVFRLSLSALSGLMRPRVSLLLLIPLPISL